ncbi:MAG: hypothetical protein HFF38_00720 [Lawsonibacter sp.]|nr:hypothetical protein [Lawsonibacter sp.]
MSAIGAIGSYGSMGGYYSIGLYNNGLQRGGANPTGTEPVDRVSRGQVSPVPPVTQVPAVHRGASQFPQEQSQFPTMREGADPAEMAVRARIHYLDREDGENQPLSWNQSKGLDGLRKGGELENAVKLPWEQKEADSPEGEDTKSPQEVMEDSECQTCKNRKYQDGSDDPGVSFKTATNVAPEQAAAAVRGHEQEHVVREQAKAKREDRKVVNQSVTIHTAICPECGDVYVSGGTTRTTTKANPVQEPQQEESKQNSGFEAMA